MIESFRKGGGVYAEKQKKPFILQGFVGSCLEKSIFESIFCIVAGGITLVLFLASMIPFRKMLYY